MNAVSVKDFVVAVILVVAAAMAFPTSSQAEVFWHDEMSREDWAKIKEREAWIREQAAACHRERLRVSDAHSQAVWYLDRRDRTLGGGYIGSGIIMRENAASNGSSTRRSNTSRRSPTRSPRGPTLPPNATMLPMRPSCRSGRSSSGTLDGLRMQAAG